VYVCVYVHIHTMAMYGPSVRSWGGNGGTREGGRHLRAWIGRAGGRTTRQDRTETAKFMRRGGLRSLALSLSLSLSLPPKNIDGWMVDRRLAGCHTHGLFRQIFPCTVVCACVRARRRDLDVERCRLGLVTVRVGKSYPAAAGWGWGWGGG